MFKKDYSRQIASFILCALLVPSVACAQAAEQGGSTTDADIPESTPESQETTAPSYTGFDDVNYGGAEILIQTENTFKSGLDTCSNYLIETAGEETGDIVSGTAYRRNCKVEDMLNVKTCLFTHRLQLGQRDKDKDSPADSRRGVYSRSVFRAALSDGSADS